MGEVLFNIFILALPFPALAFMSYKLEVLPNFRKTYLFWATFSLINFSFLAFLPFPPLVLFNPNWVAKFSNFLLPPLGASLLVVGIVIALAQRILHHHPQLRRFEAWFAYAANGIFLIVFLLAADQYKNLLISNALESRKPTCITVNSFFSSVLNAAEDFQFDAHAIFEEDGRTYYWSYAKQTFWEGKESLNKNFSCREKR